ncbi:MAG: hypothetical protein K6B14_02340 [Lachnospiraceae bacterium]|jgi:hypothetical protein|nr:hypothetical protein [Lachnospiraceae bacterium]
MDRREKIIEDIARCNNYIKKYQDRKRADIQKLKNIDRDEIHELWNGLSLTREEAEEAIRSFKRDKEGSGNSNNTNSKKEAVENEKRSD